tara:strand:- start:1909 stop:4446 length:2538 start_codon:yes stop_codon:yes gene_type:complete
MSGPNYTANSGLLSYFNFEDAHDEIAGGSSWNDYPVGNPYGRANTSGSYLGGSFSMYKEGPHPTQKDLFSFIMWATPYHAGSSAMNLIKYTSGTHTSNQADSRYVWGASSTTIDNSTATSGYMYAAITNLVSDTTYEYEDFTLSGIETDRWGMYYFGVSGTTYEMCANGEPKHVFGSGNIVVEGENGYWQCSKGSIKDELRIYDRLLDNDELAYLYNHGFPQPLYRDAPKVQHLYPASSIATNIGVQMTNLSDLVFQDLNSQDADNDTNNEYNFCRTPNTFPDRPFSFLNSWHGPYEEKSVSDVLGDRNCLMINTPNANIELGLGPCFVMPSSVNLHVKGVTFGRSDENVAMSSGLGGPLGYIDNIRFRDKNGADIIEPSGGLIFGYSGSYISDMIYLHQNSGLPLKSLVGLDLTNTSLSFDAHGGSSSPALFLNAVTIEINGSENIAETGIGSDAYLDLYTTAAEFVNSGVDLYTTAAYHENSGVDLYSYGRAVETSSIPLYTISIGTENSGMDMYTYGVQPMNSGMDLFTWGISTDNSGMELYTNGVGVMNSGMDLFTWGINSENSGMDLYTNGVFTMNSGMDLYTYGISTENSGMEMYTISFQAMNSGMDLYMSGIGRPTSGIDLTMWGRDSDNSGIDLSVWGRVAENSGMDLWIEGVQLANGSIPFYAEATVSYGSGGFPLYMNSTANTSLYHARPLYIDVNAEETSTGSLPLFLNSVTSADGDQYMPFYLESHADSITQGTDMYVHNMFESGSKSQFLYVKGLGNLDGGAVDNGSMPLFIERTEGSENGLSMYLGVNSGDEQGVNMYTFGGTWSSSGVDLVIPSTIDTKNSGLNIFIGGF